MITQERFIEICESYGLKRFPHEYAEDVLWYEIPGIDAEVCQFGSSTRDDWQNKVMSFDCFYLDEGGTIREAGDLKKCVSVKSLKKHIENVIASVKKIKKQQRKNKIEEL